jgi:hypothetical protein
LLYRLGARFPARGTHAEPFGRQQLETRPATHPSIAITMDLYSHVTPSMQVDAAAKLDDILRRAGTDVG